MTENDRVKELRKALGLTQSEFGDKIGVVKSTISAIEKGINGVTDQFCRSIVREFRVNESWLRTGDGEMFLRFDRSEEITAFLSDVLNEGDSFRSRLISVLSRLTEDEWLLLEQMAEKLKKE